MIDELRYVLIGGCCIGILIITFALVGLYLEDRAFDKLYKRRS